MSKADPSKPQQQPQEEPADVSFDLDAQADEGGEQLREEDRMRAELEEARDESLRARAELENFRKRKQRETQEDRRYANMTLMREILPVLDNLTRAIEAAHKTSDLDGLLEGVKMVDEQLLEILRKHHCQRIESTGREFDPNLHEAISQQHSDEHPPGTVLLETQTGYQLHDRVVRPSQVIVSHKQEPPDDV